MPTSPTKGSLPDPSVIKFQLKSLSQVAASLNHASDSLSQIVKQIEDRINGLGLGVEANVKITQWSNETGDSELWRLAYRKVETTKKWGFEIECLGNDDQYGSPEYESWPFKDAPRDYRILAVPKISALMEALQEKASQTVSELSENAAFANSLLRQLSSETDSEKG